MSEKLLLTSQRVLHSGTIQPAGILIENGMITEIFRPEQIPSSIQTIDYGRDVIMPGLIDPHVHVNEPGRTEWEGFETATKAAAAGGITAIADMPLNSSPVTTNADALKKKRNAAAGKCFVDYACYGGLIPGNENQIEDLLDQGVPGIKTFLSHSGIDEFPNSAEKELRAVMPLLAKRNIPLLVHAELTDNNVPGMLNPNSYQQYMQSRPQRWEMNAINLLITLCRETGCPVHIVHLSAADALPNLKLAREEGLPISVETAPHYLFFESEHIPDGDPRFKCAPPIRNSENRKALWGALKNRIIDFIGTDHSPSPPELKTGTLKNAWGGISSLQLLLPALWTAARAEDITLAELSSWTSTRPAQFLGIDHYCGEIAVDKQANLVVWSPEESFEVDISSLYHRHKQSPYDGKLLQGIVKETWLRGTKIYDKSGILGRPQGSEIVHSTK